jgi:SAM-dependent methyltransferase
LAVLTETAAEPYLALGAHLVGSVPLANAEAVFRTVSAGLGDRLRRIPDGETGPRADWIVWQYPVLSSRPQFEIAPPAPGFYRALPQLRLRTDDVRFESLGYADAAIESYRTFGVLKRDGVVPRGCRFQVSLPTPLAPISAFVALDDQAVVEPAYEEAMTAELGQIFGAIPHDQLALQWDTNFEFGMLEGDLPVWFGDVKGGILERLLRISRLVPPDVELGFHFCEGHDEQAARTRGDASRMVEIANALAASLDRPLNWVHMPLPRRGSVAAAVAPLAGLRLQPQTELYLGLIDPAGGDGAAAERIQVTHDAAGDFGIATPCGWGRLPPASVPALVELHARLSRPVADPAASREPPFTWPGAFARIPDEDWVERPVEEFALHYDTVENHGWYRNLDLTVEQLAGDLHSGDVLIDYSGGTGILLDRLRLRIFDRQVGMVIVDSSPKFLRVAVDRFREDERVAFRRLHFLKDERRLQFVDEVLGETFRERPADVLVSTNAIHLYDDLPGTVAGWARVLKPGGRVYVNSGNIRNPRARENEWIIDETVYVVHEVAAGLVRTDPRYEPYRAVLEDERGLRAYLEFRDRVFLEPRPLDYYLDTLRAGGFEIQDVSERTIEADVEEWFEFLSAYADAVLGWVGGSAKVDGAEASEAAARDRLDLLRASLDVIFGGRPTFLCCWTYVTATRS